MIWFSKLGKPMLEVRIIAVGKVRKTDFAELNDEYTGRIRWPLTVSELESKSKIPLIQKQEESDKILSMVSADMHVIALDERGRELSSEAFASEISRLQDIGKRKLVFVIGGSEGLTDEVRARADMLLSFGRQTWPHMLARVMLLEQIYRAQQILSGHPYHK